MARHASARKAAKQSLRRQVRNRSAKNAFRTEIKKFQDELKAASPKKETVAALLKEVQKKLMSTASKGIIPKERASRYISRLSRLAQRKTA